MTTLRCLIGIPTLNGPDRLRRCLQSVRACTQQGDDVLVLVSDDGSSADNLEENKTIVHSYGLEMLTTGGLRLGIAAQWNRLVRHTDARTIALINDDVEVVPNWLDVLTYSVEQNPEVGVVSLCCRTGAVKPSTPEPHIDYVESRLLDGGGTLLSAGGSCFAFLRSSWEVAGGFDERYFVFYEEVDFSVTLARAGRFNYFASEPVVYHLGGATNSDPQNLAAAAHLARSRQLFVEKWHAHPEELRQELSRRQRPSHLREWNSQLKFLKE